MLFVTQRYSVCCHGGVKKLDHFDLKNTQTDIWIMYYKGYVVGDSCNR